MLQAMGGLGTWLNFFSQLECKFSSSMFYYKISLLQTRTAVHTNNMHLHNSYEDVTQKCFKKMKTNTKCIIAAHNDNYTTDCRIMINMHTIET